MELRDIDYPLTYKNDNRMPVDKIYNSFLKLNSNQWKTFVIYNQKFEVGGKIYSLPIFGFKTLKKGKALWIISGIHGEEPAGPNAIAKNINFLNILSKKIPLVLIPLCNPSGYARNWRYTNKKRASKKLANNSVGDSEFLLLDKTGKKPRANKPACEEAYYLNKFAIETSNTHPPLVVLDFHEDLSSSGTYIYSQGELGPNDPIAVEIVKILRKNKFNLKDSGKTRFDQNVINGIVSYVDDGSFGELLSSKKIILDGRVINGPCAKSVVTIETNIVKIPIFKRISTHSEILRLSKSFFDKISEIFLENVI